MKQVVICLSIILLHIALLLPVKDICLRLGKLHVVQRLEGRFQASKSQFMVSQLYFKHRHASRIITAGGIFELTGDKSK
jgi:hypothetical protein